MIAVAGSENVGPPTMHTRKFVSLLLFYYDIDFFITSRILIILSSWKALSTTNYLNNSNMKLCNGVEPIQPKY